MQLQKMVSMRVSLFPRVRYFSVKICRQLISYYGRSAGLWKYLVGIVLNSGGDLVLTFCRAVFRDPSIYPEPDMFKPERFLNSDGSLRDDPLLSSAFGYGKRICPGRHFVDTTLFIYAASLLSVFRIENAQDGQERCSKYKYSGILIR
jgi:hypothetical protein